MCVCYLAQMNVPETQIGCTALHPVLSGATNLLQGCGSSRGQCHTPGDTGGTQQTTGLEIFAAALVFLSRALKTAVDPFFMAIFFLTIHL